MPRRDEYLEAYWIRKVKVAPDGRHYVNPPGDRTAVVVSRTAVLKMTSRTGMQYTREVRRSGYVTQREAAKLLKVSVMTVNRWVRNGTLRSITRKGVSVIAVRDVVALADNRGIEAKLVFPPLPRRKEDRG